MEFYGSINVILKIVSILRTDYDNQVKQVSYNHEIGISNNSLFHKDCASCASIFGIERKW